MLYRFPEMFYKNPPSPCAPDGEGESLSAGDRAGLQLLYPGGPASAPIMEKQQAILAAMGGMESADLGLESVSTVGQQIASAARVLARKLQTSK
jgi:hypothetical protein